MMKNTTGTIQGNQNTTMLLNYLKNAEKQYPALDKKAERALIKKYKTDRDALNQLLFMHNVKMVFNIAKRYKGKTTDFDGMIQNGMVGLMEAAKRFDITKNIKFITYAYPWISKYVLSEFYVKNKEIDQNSCSLNQTMMFKGKGNEDVGEFEDCVNSYIDQSVAPISNIHDELSAHEQDSLVSTLLQSMQADNNLSSTDKLVFMDIFYNRERPSDIADKYDMTMHDVNEIKRKVLGKFKIELALDHNICSYSDVP